MSNVSSSLGMSFPSEVDIGLEKGVLGESGGAGRTQGTNGKPIERRRGKSYRRSLGLLYGQNWKIWISRLSNCFICMHATHRYIPLIKMAMAYPELYSSALNL
jgi:hypothetical protein